MLKIDVFPHILPRRFYDRLMDVAPRSGLMVKRVSNIPVMIDLDRRFEIMDRHEGYRQVLTLAAPPLEAIAGPDVTPDLARLANDEMAAIVEKYPDRFPAFVAQLPMNNPDAAVREVDRAIDELGATGVQIYTNVGRPRARQSRIPADLRAHGRTTTCPCGCTRRAAPTSRTTSAKSGRSTTCGGRSAGRTSRPWRWRGCCFPACSIGTRT